MSNFIYFLNGPTKLRWHRVLTERGYVMREAEFIQLLDEVDAALNPAIFDRWTEQPDLYQLPVAANDNETPWNHAPFPKGWIASC